MNLIKIFTDGHWHYDLIIRYAWMAKNKPEALLIQKYKNALKPFTFKVNKTDKSKYESKFHLIENMPEAEIQKICKNQMTKSDFKSVSKVLTYKLYQCFRTDIEATKLHVKAGYFIVSESKKNEALQIKKVLTQIRTEFTTPTVLSQFKSHKKQNHFSIKKPTDSVLVG